MNDSNKHTFKVLTRKNAITSHVETEITIDWTGISKEDLVFLARVALVYDAQAMFVKSNKAIPLEHTILAADVVKKPIELTKYCPKPKKVHTAFDLDELLKTYTVQELIAMLK